MRKRQTAPGELEQVREFVNTLDITPGDEQLREPEDLRRWLIDRGLGPADLRVTRPDLARAIELREALRAVLVAHTDGQPAPAEASRKLDQFAARARLGLRFDEHGGANVEPAATGVNGALGRLLTIVHGAIADGSWARLKGCRDHTCEWAFYDHTKNRSGTWCNMDTCGNRAKARSYRGRRADGAA
ncbi:MAG TPA: CGNR zinc finger domain-containing protein [Solirubrobacteraceae bacterium]|nr:CGNR zinc finger domain-containing protein [Solirubrobacteraceae bacterium]